MVPQRSLIPEEHHGEFMGGKEKCLPSERKWGKGPFFLWSSFIAPHPPFDVPEKWADLYKGKELPPLKESKTPISGIAEWKNILQTIPMSHISGARELYYASISFVDYNIGTILQQLKDMGEYDNTPDSLHKRPRGNAGGSRNLPEDASV